MVREKSKKINDEIGNLKLFWQEIKNLRNLDRNDCKNIRERRGRLHRVRLK